MATNPYLSIDKKYFKSELDGQFIITTIDLINMPELKKYVNVSYLNNNKLVFDEFPDQVKLDIGKIFFNYYGYISWIGENQYLNFKTFFEKYEIQENLNYEISKLNPNYYYEQDSETQLYLMEFISDGFLLLLITYYFYSRYSSTEDSQKYIQYSENLTDVDLNMHHYNKVPEDINFVINIFNNWIRTTGNTIPFAPGYGNSLKELIQEKNIIVKLNNVRNNIVLFFEDFSKNYTDLVTLKDVRINIISHYGIEIVINLDINGDINIFNVIVKD